MAETGGERESAMRSRVGLLRHVEPGYSLAAGLKALRLSMPNTSAGIATFLFSIAGPIIVMVNLSGQIGMDRGQLIAFIMIGQGVGAAVSAFLSLRYRIPLVMTPSMATFIVVSNAYGQYTQSEVVFGIIITGLLVTFLGLSGMLARLKGHLPMPIVSAMVAGIMFRQPLNVISSLQTAPVACGIVLLTFLLTPIVSKKLPQQLTVVVAAALVVFFTTSSGPSADVRLFAPPSAVVPHPSLRALSICLPLAMVVISDTLSSYGILRSNGYDAPVNCVLACSGLASAFTASALCPAVTLASVGSALTSSDSAGPREQRYGGSIIKSACSIAISPFASGLLFFVFLLPSHLMDMLSGLMVIEIVLRSLQTAFLEKRYQYGAFAAFLVGVSQVSIGGVSTCLLSLLCGVAVSAMLDKKTAAG